MQRHHSIVVLAIVLTACGNSASSSQPLAAPSTFTPSPLASDAAATAATAANVPNVGDATDPLSAVTLVASDGRVWTRGGTSGALDGVVAADGKTVVAVAPSSGEESATVAWFDSSTGETLAAVDIGPALRVSAVSSSGDLAVLTDAKAGGAAASSHIVAVDRRTGTLGDWTMPGNLVPEAFSDAFPDGGNGLPIGIFVIEYIRPDVYRVRVLDTISGVLSLPLNLRNKSQTVDEAMEAIGRTAAFDSANRLLFTLYQGVADDGLPTTAFVHTLGLINGVYCLDLPPALALGELPGALAVDPWGRRLYVASPNGGLAAFTIRDILDPAVAPVAEPVAWFESGASVAVLATDDDVVVAFNAPVGVEDGVAALVLHLDPVTLAELRRFTSDIAVEAMAMTATGDLILAGDGRLRVVNAMGTVLGERRLPDDLGTIATLVVGPLPA